MLAGDYRYHKHTVPRHNWKMTNRTVQRETHKHTKKTTEFSPKRGPGFASRLFSEHMSRAGICQRYDTFHGLMKTAICLSNTPNTRGSRQTGGRRRQRTPPSVSASPGCCSPGGWQVGTLHRNTSHNASGGRLYVLADDVSLRVVFNSNEYGKRRGSFWCWPALKANSRSVGGVPPPTAP